MTNVNNNTSTPMSLRQIVGAVEEEMDKLGLLSAHEGQVAGQLSDTQVSVAQNYKGYLDKYQQQSEQQQKVASALSIVSSSISGIGGAGGLAGLKASSSAMSQGVAGAAQTVVTAAKVVGAPLAQAASGIGKAVMAEKVGEAQSKESEYQAVNDLAGGVSGDAVDSVGQATDQRSTVFGNLHQAISDENQASDYSGR